MLIRTLTPLLEDETTRNEVEALATELQTLLEWFTDKNITVEEEPTLIWSVGGISYVVSEISVGVVPEHHHSSAVITVEALQIPSADVYLFEASAKAIRTYLDRLKHVVARWEHWFSREGVV